MGNGDVRGVLLNVYHGRLPFHLSDNAHSVFQQDVGVAWLKPHLHVDEVTRRVRLSGHWLQTSSICRGRGWRDEGHDAWRFQHDRAGRGQ